MNRRTTIALGTTALLCAGLALSGSAIAQQKSLKEQLVGTWDAVSVTIDRPDGSKLDPYNGKLKGRSIYTSDGHFSQQNTGTDVRPFASGTRSNATAEEFKTAYIGSYSLFGTYTVNEADKTLTLRILASSFPNEIGAEHKRTFTINGDMLTYVNPAPPAGGSGAVNVLKLAKQ
jgi:Lipocalin-like domain